MTSIEQLGIPRDRPFDYQFLMDRLKEYAAPRDKVTNLMRAREIVRVKKGLYIGATGGGVEAIDPLVLAGLIYGPSYVSLETALAHHGLIPERVEEIACMSTKRTRSFRTPLGRYRYCPVPDRAFAVGVTLEQANGGGFFLATPEKALSDRVAREKGLRDADDMESFVLGSLRIEPEALDRLSIPRLHRIDSAYRRAPIHLLSQWIEERVTSPSQ